VRAAGTHMSNDRPTDGPTDGTFPRRRNTRIVLAMHLVVVVGADVRPRVRRRWAGLNAHLQARGPAMTERQMGKNSRLLVHFEFSRQLRYALAGTAYNSTASVARNNPSFPSTHVFSSARVSRNHMSKLRQIFFACCLWYVVARFCCGSNAICYMSLRFCS